MAGSLLEGILSIGSQTKKRQRMYPSLEMPLLGLRPSGVFLLKRKVLVLRKFQEPRGNYILWKRGDQSLQPPESQLLILE